MPTTVYVDITSSGNNTDAGGYTTLTQACTDYSDATHGKDLVAADTLLIFRVHDDFGGFITETGANFGTAGYTTDATRYIIVAAASGDECSYTETSGARLRVTSKFNQVFETQNTTKVIGKNLVLKQDIGSVINGEGVVYSHALEGCMVITTRGVDSINLWSMRKLSGDSSITDQLLNTMFVRSGGAANAAAVVGLNFDPLSIQGCCFIGCYVDAGPGTAQVSLNDTVIYNTAGTTFVNASAKTVVADNNAFSDATGVGTNKQLSIGTDQFTNYAGGDYTTAAGSTMQTNGIGIITSTPTITVDQANLTPGGTISGTYTNFASTPTSPAVLTDSNSNALNVTVTVTGTSSTGTFTGTMPSLPTTGNTSNFLLFGTVSVALD